MFEDLLKTLPQALLKALPVTAANFRVKLQGVNGYTGRAEAECTIWKNGRREVEIELRGVAGRAADLYLNNIFISSINLDNGRAERCFKTQKGDAVPDFDAGARIDIRQHGDVILEGVLDS